MRRRVLATRRTFPFRTAVGGSRRAPSRGAARNAAADDDDVHAGDRLVRINTLALRERVGLKPTPDETNESRLNTHYKKSYLTRARATDRKTERPLTKDRRTKTPRPSGYVEFPSSVESPRLSLSLSQT